MPPIRLLHVITDLGMGGAEMNLYRLLSRLDRTAFDLAVVSLTDSQPVGDLISHLDIPVTALGFHPGFPDPRMLPRLAAVMRNFHPDLVQTWMYHADLLGSLASRMAGSPPVVWGIRHTVADRRALKPATLAVAHWNAWLSSRIPVRIVCCAEAGRLSHIRLGYSASKMVVIPNGFDTDLFHPDASARSSLRRELGLPDNTLLVGLCARFHPEKDLQTFIRAAGILHASMDQVHFVMWGKGLDAQNTTLTTWLDEARIRERIHLLGMRNDSPRLFAALDVSALSSFTEAFPTVIGEAMACGIPCVATDAGDIRSIIADAGIVVPTRDPSALATGLLQLLAHPAERQSLGNLARRRILDNYSLEKMTSAYSALYRDIIAGGRQ